MGKKIGIVTLTGGSNYGNKLQHYAVLYTLRKLGYDAVTVRDQTINGFADPAFHVSLCDKCKVKYIRRAFSSRMQYRYHRKNKEDGIIRAILREKRMHAKFALLEAKRQEVFDEFDKIYLAYDSLTVSSTTRPEQEMVDSFYAFVCGSDQVWNPNYPHFSPVRLLAFAPPEKRIALSPSFGVTAIPESRREFYRHYLGEFHALSVREESGARIIEELTGQKAPILIDPTLFLSAKDWEALERKPEGFHDGAFLLTYFLGNKTKDTRIAIERIAKKHRLITVDLFEITKPCYFIYGPCEFLWLVHHASFICTDSFHGTVFSLLFHKNFFAFTRDEVGFSSDNRLVTLLSKLGLEGCWYRGQAYVRPDYSLMEKHLETEREAFFSYIKEAVDTAGRQENKFPHIGTFNRKHPTNCTGCSACMYSCSVHAIEMKADQEGFLYPEVNDSICVHCGKCISICNSENYLEKGMENVAYAAFHNVSDVRWRSSSGGVFAAMADWVIKKHGVVFGAAFDKDWKLRHTCIDSMEKIASLMGSKYVQSDIGDSYICVKNYLENGRIVLFTGTPCQVAGLKAFLKKDYAALFCVDLICHGIPSQMAFDSYLKESFDKESEIRAVSFRNKDVGWNRFSMKIESRNGTYRKDLNHDPYLVAFLRNCNLRESCYDCRFKTVGRCSDITIADFWGVQINDRSFQDDKGVSLAIVHSDKGREMLESLSLFLTVEKVPIEEAVKKNQAICKSVLRPQARDIFYPEIRINGFRNTVQRMYPMTLKRRYSLVKEYIYKLVYHK